MNARELAAKRGKVLTQGPHEDVGDRTSSRSSSLTIPFFVPHSRWCARTQWIGDIDQLKAVARSNDVHVVGIDPGQNQVLAKTK